MRLSILPLAAMILASACTTAGNASPPPAPAAAAMIPARTLHCTLGRALNLDPEKYQTIDEIRHEGAYGFSLFLPATPVRQGPPPDPSADAEPVDPATRILADPAGLAGDMKPGFVRVVDLWPERVEMIGAIVDSMLTRLIIISDIDPAKGTANLFMTRAADAASLDLANVHQGGCRVETTPAPAG